MAYPLLITPAGLAGRLGDPSLLLVDNTKRGIYEQLHLPGAIHVDYRFLTGDGPTLQGLPPSRERIAALLDGIGLTPDRQVVAYDEEGGCRASRFLWLLELAGHRHYSLLDGGIHAWLAEERPCISEAVEPVAGSYPLAGGNRHAIVEIDEMLARYDNPGVVLWDARSPAEFSGSERRALRAGHIPGAINYAWDRALQAGGEHRLRDLDAIRSELAAIGIDGSREIITYCQAHHRASFAWFLGRLLGYDIRGYAGAWAEWGNREDTPVAGG